jgi:mRNA interferase MazF
MEAMKRGDLVTIAVSGDYGKPRPALVVQADAFVALPSVTVLRLTSELHAEHLLRVTIHPSPDNGLRVASQVMIDKAVTVPRERIGSVIGHLETIEIQEVSRALMRFLGLSALTA